LKELLMTVAPSPLEQFKWETQPQAEKLVLRLIEKFLAQNPGANTLAARMKSDTGTRFQDWVDEIHTNIDAAELESVGFEKDPHGAYAHPGALFPRIIPTHDSVTRLSIKVDSVTDYLAINAPSGVVASATTIEGEPLNPYRRAKISSTANSQLFIAERHGYRGLDIPRFDPTLAIKSLHHLELFRTRPRDFATDAQGFDAAEKLIDASIADLGVPLTCDLFFQAEREFWQHRNRAAQVQKKRQDRLGLGWANHDHHTYRASRANFTRLVAMWEKLGFECRERYHAGWQAGWGAQVMDCAATGITTFNDVDLSPDELFQDFSHEPLPEQKSLGTVGLWCALHGDSFLQSGMHHLECQFDFDALVKQLAAENVNTMKPFTNFPYLRQAFTEGERWPVSESRISSALSAGLITPDQAQTFRTQGAVGSHLENLERNEGFKGFNQKGVSEIISATDPRKLNR
jgi:hypothetical protein